MGLRWVLAPAAAIVAAAACCSPAGAVVGGTRASAGAPPTGPLDYQVALIRNDRPTTASGQFCGGSVRADSGQSRHIVTAAHCVFDNSATSPGQPIDPANLDVLLTYPHGALFLKAVSCGSVFMGANTYIGNGPNFMVKAIAEQHHVRMPSFFGYVVWSGAILVPLFGVVSHVFF